MKYLVYRSFGNLDRDIKKHELIAVEYGKDIRDVTDKLIKEITDDLLSTPEYAGCQAYADAPQRVGEKRRVKRYDYEITGVVLPPHAGKNYVIEFGVIETEGNEP